MSKEVGLLDGPFTLEWIDSETVVSKSGENLIEQSHVRVKVIAEAGNVVDVDFDVIDGTEDAFHNFLGNVRRLTDVHRKATVMIESKGSCDCAKIFAGVEFEGLILH